MSGKPLPISKLTSAALRLLVSLQQAGPTDTRDDVVVRAGIHGYQTYISAYQQLVKHGFIVVHEGREYPNLWMQEPARLSEERYSYPGTTIITKAVQ